MGSRGAERDVACFALVTRPPGSTITNRAGSGGKGASRAALSVNGPTYVSRDRDEPHPTQRHGSSGLSDPVEAYEVRRADLRVAGYI